MNHTTTAYRTAHPERMYGGGGHSYVGLEYPFRLDG